jgi:hypothetical protein
MANLLDKSRTKDGQHYWAGNEEFYQRFSDEMHAAAIKLGGRATQILDDKVPVLDAGSKVAFVKETLALMQMSNPKGASDLKEDVEFAKIAGQKAWLANERNKMWMVFFNITTGEAHAATQSH